MNVNIRFDYRRLRAISILFLAFTLTLSVFLVTVSYSVQVFDNRHNDITSLFLMFWGINTMSMFLGQAILLILSIKQRFMALNQLLLLKSSLIAAHQLRIISQVHLHLTEAIEVMNESYCMMLMLFLAGSFGMFNLFLFASKSVILAFNMEILVFTGKVLMNFYAFALTFMVIAVASSTSKEANRTVRVLFETLNSYERDSDWKNAMVNFVHQVTLSQTKFSCGLFNFDWKLGFKVKRYQSLDIVIGSLINFNYSS